MPSLPETVMSSRESPQRSRSGATPENPTKTKMENGKQNAHANDVTTKGIELENTEISLRGRGIESSKDLRSEPSKNHAKPEDYSNHASTNAGFLFVNPRAEGQIKDETLESAFHAIFDILINVLKSDLHSSDNNQISEIVEELSLGTDGPDVTLAVETSTC